MAGRLQNLMTAASSAALDGLRGAITLGDRTEAVRILRTIKGVGPTVAATAWELLKK